MVLTFGLLAAALGSLWLGGGRTLARVPLWGWLALGALAAGLTSGSVRPVGVAGIAA